MTEHKFIEAMAAALGQTASMARRRNHRIGPGKNTIYTWHRDVLKHRKQMERKPHPKTRAGQFPEYRKWLDAHPDIKQELEK